MLEHLDRLMLSTWRRQDEPIVGDRSFDRRLTYIPLGYEYLAA